MIIPSKYDCHCWRVGPASGWRWSEGLHGLVFDGQFWMGCWLPKDSDISTWTNPIPIFPHIPKNSALRYASIVNCNGFPDPALGPHDCLTPEPDGKIIHVFSFVLETGIKWITSLLPFNSYWCPNHKQGRDHSVDNRPCPREEKVDFLGVQLSSCDAEVALYVIFAFFLASVLLGIYAVFWVLRARKKLKEVTADFYKMDGMWRQNSKGMFVFY